MLRRPVLPLALAAATTSALLVALPGTAYAAPVPVVDAVDALHALDTASLTAAAAGFTEVSVFDAQAPATLQYDPVSRIRLLVVPLGGGSYVKQLDTPTADCQWFERDALNRAATALAGVPAAAWVCRAVPGNPDYTHDLGVSDLFADTSATEPAPGGLTQVVETADLTGTSTDGTWTITSHEAGDGGAAVIHRTYTAAVVGGKVTAVDLAIHADNDTPDLVHDTIDYTPPTLTMLPRTATISAARLALARAAVGLRPRMARYATAIALDANAYAAARHRRTLVRDVAGWTRVVLARNPLGLVVYRSARYGVVLYGRNPFTRELVSYSVLVSHGRAAVHLVA